jgi:hypothetical protein
MRPRLIGISFILVASASAVASQSLPFPSIAVTLRQLDSPKAWDVAVGVQHNEFYVTGGSADVPAKPMVAGAKVGPHSFRIRAWREGEKARVVVYAAMLDDRAPKSETETPIATFSIGLGQSVEVSETEKWGAAHVVVGAMVAPTVRAPAMR